MRQIAPFNCLNSRVHAPGPPTPSTNLNPTSLQGYLPASYVIIDLPASYVKFDVKKERPLFFGLHFFGFGGLCPQIRLVKV